MGKGWGASYALSCSHCPQNSQIYQPSSFLNSGFLGFSGSFITWAWMIKSLANDHWINLQVLSFPWTPRGGTESYNPLITWLVLLATYPHPQTGSKSHFINITKDTFIALLPGTSKVFSSSVPEMRVKNKYIFLLRNHSACVFPSVVSDSVRPHGL